MIKNKTLNENIINLTVNDYMTQKITEKYEFIISWKKAIFFRMNLFFYLNSQNEIKTGIELISEKKNKILVKNIYFVDEDLIGEYYNENNTDDFNSFIVSLLNNGLKNDIFLDEILDIKRLLEYLNENKENSVFFFKPNSIYFDEYIEKILKNSIKEILGKELNKKQGIPNFFSDKKCDNSFKIVIADIHGKNKDFWATKMKYYLDKDYMAEKRFPTKGKTMMSQPPESHIDSNDYFHFIAINEKTNIVGYVICEIIPFKFSYKIDSEKELFEEFLSHFKGRINSEDLNLQNYIDYLINSIDNNKNDIKTNLFEITSLSVDRDYRGSQFRIAHFLIYYALLFAQNTLNELDLVISGTESAAEATTAILSKYFGFTNKDKKRLRLFYDNLTDILFFENEIFHKNMKDYALRFKQCFDQKETTIKSFLSLNELNYIFE